MLQHPQELMLFCNTLMIKGMGATTKSGAPAKISPHCVFMCMQISYSTYQRKHKGLELHRPHICHTQDKFRNCFYPFHWLIAQFD